MRILILGGTQFVGRHIAQAALRAGHAVTVFNRALSPDPLPPHVQRLRGDRDAGPDGLAALRSGTWDACIDVSGYTPAQVRPALTLLKPRVRRYIFISAVAVYADPDTGPVTEACPRVPPAPDDVVDLDQEMYGRAKVACEDLCTQVYGQHLTILRPQIVAGPYDPFDRYSYWVRRAAQPGPILAPGDGSDHVQVIDARDVARFALLALEKDLCGAFNLSGPRLTWAQFLAALGARADALRWTPASLLRSQGVTEQVLPLFRAAGSPRSMLMHVSSERAQRAGLELTSPDDTARCTRAWLQSDERAPALSPERERAMIALAQPGMHRRGPSTPAT